MNLLAQFFGLLALCSIVTAMQIKDKNRSLVAIGLANLFFAINFLLLEAYSGSVVCFLAVIQAIVFYTYNKKGKEIPKYIVALFVIAILIAGVYSYSNIYSIFPLIASMLNIFGMYTKNMKVFRIINLVISMSWIIYDIVSGAYTSLLSHLISLTSVIIAIIRYDIKKANKE